MIKKFIFISLMLLSFLASSAPTVRIYTAIMSQNGNLDPVVYVLHNDFGSLINWTRVSKGYYVGKLPGAFIPFRTWATLESDNVSAIIYGNIDEIVIVTRNTMNLPADNILNQSSVEIRVYNGT